AFQFDHYARVVVANETRKMMLLRKAVDEGAKADALNNSLHRNLTPLGHGKRLPLGHCVADAVPSRRMAIAIGIAAFEMAFLSQRSGKFFAEASFPFFDAADRETKSQMIAAVLSVNQARGDQAVKGRFELC